MIRTVQKMFDMGMTILSRRGEARSSAQLESVNSLMIITYPGRVPPLWMINFVDEIVVINHLRGRHRRQ